MKKFFILLAILTFCATPIMAEDELPTMIDELQSTVVEVDGTKNKVDIPDGYELVPIEEVSENEILETEVEETVFDKEKIVDYKTFKITSIDANKTSKKQNRLEIYTSLYGKTTNTDKKGFEAVIVDNKVVKLNQHNSYIPQNGYVVSGFGKGKKFILENLFEGADVDIDFDKAEFKVVTHPDNYIYEASYRLEKVKELFANADESKVDAYNMKFYIKRSDEILNRTKKVVEFQDYETAKAMANDSMVYSDMAYYSSLAYNPDEYKAVWVFPYQKTQEEVEQAFNALKKLEVQNIIIEGYYNGLTIYPSEVAKKYNLPEQNRYYKEFDPLSAWVELAKENNKNIIVSFNVLNMGNPQKSIIKSHLVSVYPEWKNEKLGKNCKDTLYLDPANIEVQHYNLELIQEVLDKYEIAGVNIKNLQYPSMDWGYTDVAKEEFEKLYGINPQDLSEDDEKFAIWQDYKETIISDFANKIAQLVQEKEKLVSFNIYADKNIGQNIAEWNFGENAMIMPVLSSSDNDFAQDFLSSIKANSTTEKIYPIYLEPYQEEKPRRLFDQISTARELGLKGIVLYNLGYLNSEYYEALKISIFNAPEKQKEQKSLMEQMTEEDNTEEKEENGTTIEN